MLKKELLIVNKFQNDFTMSVWEPSNRDINSFQTNDFWNIVKKRGRQRSQFEKSEVVFKNYFTENNNEKENFEPQTTYQTLNSSEMSLSFGPKASNMVNIPFIILLETKPEKACILSKEKSWPQKKAF